MPVSRGNATSYNGMLLHGSVRLDQLQQVTSLQAAVLRMRTMNGAHLYMAGLAFSEAPWSVQETGGLRGITNAKQHTQGTNLSYTVSVYLPAIRWEAEESRLKNDLRASFLMGCQPSSSSSSAKTTKSATGSAACKAKRTPPETTMLFAP